MNLHLLALTLLAPLALRGSQQSASASAAATPARTDANAAAAASAVPVDRSGNPIPAHTEADVKSSGAAPLSSPSATTYLPAPEKDAQFNEDLLKQIAVLKKQIQEDVKGMNAEKIRDGQSHLVHCLVTRGFYTGFPKGWAFLHIANVIHHEGNQPIETMLDKGLARATQKLMIDTLSTLVMRGLFKTEVDISRFISRIPIFTLGQLLRSHIQNRPDHRDHKDMPRYENKLQQLTRIWNARHRMPVTSILLAQASFPVALIHHLIGFIDPEPPALSIEDLISYRLFYEHGLEEHVRLELSHNQLTTIDDLGLISEPDNRMRERTTEIHLNGNCLTSLPDILRTKFRNCAKLYLSGNRLTEIDTACLPLSLKYLDLSHNQIGSLPVEALKAYAEQNCAVTKTTFVLNLVGNPLLKDPQELEKICELQKILYIKTSLSASEPQKGTE